jgi:hypothetical protein
MAWRRSVRGQRQLSFSPLGKLLLQCCNAPKEGDRKEFRTNKPPPSPIAGNTTVCNFPASTATQPSLLPHDDVVGWGVLAVAWHGLWSVNAFVVLGGFGGSCFDAPAARAVQPGFGGPKPAEKSPKTAR